MHCICHIPKASQGPILKISRRIPIRWFDDSLMFTRHVPCLRCLGCLWPETRPSQVPETIEHSRFEQHHSWLIQLIDTIQNTWIAELMLNWCSSKSEVWHSTMRIHANRYSFLLTLRRLLSLESEAKVLRTNMVLRRLGTGQLPNFAKLCQHG